VAYDADAGQLTVCPESSAWAPKARLEKSRVIAAANKAAGRAVVSTLRILPSSTVPAPDPGDVGTVGRCESWAGGRSPSRRRHPTMRQPRSSSPRPAPLLVEKAEKGEPLTDA
jgi:hypothetical protein